MTGARALVTLGRQKLSSLPRKSDLGPESLLDRNGPCSTQGEVGLRSDPTPASIPLTAPILENQSSVKKKSCRLEFFKLNLKSNVIIRAVYKRLFVQVE